MQITIWEPSSVDRKNAPVTVGYPFAKGRFFDTMSLSLCGCGNELPLSYTITSRWDDGSVRWALLDFQTDLRGNEKKRFSVIQRSPLFSAKSGVAGGFCEIFRFWIPYLWYADRYDCLTDLTIV